MCWAVVARYQATGWDVGGSSSGSCLVMVSNVANVGFAFQKTFEDGEPSYSYFVLFLFLFFLLGEDMWKSRRSSRYWLCFESHVINLSHTWTAMLLAPFPKESQIQNTLTSRSFSLYCISDMDHWGLFEISLQTFRGLLHLHTPPIHYHCWFQVMWVKQCHKPSPSHRHFYRWYNMVYINHSQ